MSSQVTTNNSNQIFSVRSAQQYHSASRKLVLFNSLGSQKSEFSPIDTVSEKPTVKMYVCGLTPQDSAHMGHIIPALRFDMLRNYLEYRNLNVNYVQNVTDIDDKIVARTLKSGEDPLLMTRRITDEFYNNMQSMFVRMPSSIVRVSESLPQIIRYIEELIKREAAYSTAEGNVYFDITKKADYGKLSRQRVNDLQEGVRVETEKDKRHPLDFALWKNDRSSSLSVDSPWGIGRPGWHIECSVMIDCTLGTPIDIHGGGLDLKFPHHENEIAQSEAHDGHDFVKVWMHAGVLTVDGTKMSKSLGNFLTIQDAFSKFGQELIRYVFLNHHYRSSINLSGQVFMENINGLWDFYKTIAYCDRLYGIVDSVVAQDKYESANELVRAFEEAMDDDLNAPLALVALRRALNKLRHLLTENPASAPKDEAQVLCFYIKELGRVLGLFYFDSLTVLQQLFGFMSYHKKSELADLKQIEQILHERLAARSNKNYAESDRIRDVLKAYGLEYLDSKQAWPEGFSLLYNLRFV